jgi:hypothetical protein
MKPFNTSRLLLITIFASIAFAGNGQQILSRSVSLNVNRQRLDQVMEIISNKANFYFSYHSNIIKSDSLVSISVANRTVGYVLEQLLGDGFEFRESGNYLIIRRVPVTITIITNKAVSDEKMYTVSGYVLNDLTGMQIANASVYEKQLLVSSLTDEKGFFKLRLKSRSKKAAITVSKEFYEDTTVIIDPGFNQQVTITLLPEEDNKTITIRPEDYFVPDSLRVRMETRDGMVEYTYVRADSSKVEFTRMARFLLSSRQKMQTLNLKKFFTSRPYQVSLIPGVSTNGKMSGQVITNFSLNILGGYTGGTNGIEIGGLFNIDKKNVRFLQAGGLVNIVGGNVLGLQAAGLNNTVLGSVTGLQAAGIYNFSRRDVIGFQAAGIHNHVADSIKGIQVAGVSNYAHRKAHGVQVAGVGNIANKEMNGVQVAGLFNYAKKMKGVQIGLINISGESDGYSIGLINVVLKGYHKLAFYSNEVLQVNAAFKTGSTKLYSMLFGGAQLRETEKAWSFGYGLGKEWRLGRTFSLNPELTGQYLYLGSWDYLNLLGRAQLHLNIKLGKSFALFGGPAFSAYYSDQALPVDGYKFQVPSPVRKTYDIDHKVTGWFGWNAGISFF